MNKIKSAENKENKSSSNIVKKNDFIELRYTGYQEGKIFDSNVEKDLKEISPKSKPEKTVIVVGQGMLVPGLDKAIEGKEIGKDYEIDVPYNEGFGPRNKELIKIVPLKVFLENKINPYPGAVLALDDRIVKILTVNGARVTVDFNNPMAGKNLEYRFNIVRKVSDLKEKTEAFFKVIFRFVPEFEVDGNKAVIRGPKEFENLAKIYGKKFNEMVGAELGFELKEPEKKEAREENSEKGE